MIYKTANTISNDNPKLITLIANVYVLTNNYTQAIKYYKKAIKLDPKNNEIKLIYIEMASHYIENKLKGRK